MSPISKALGIGSECESIEEPKDALVSEIPEVPSPTGEVAEISESDITSKVASPTAEVPKDLEQSEVGSPTAEVPNDLEKSEVEKSEVGSPTAEVPKELEKSNEDFGIHGVQTQEKPFQLLQAKPKPAAKRRAYSKRGGGIKDGRTTRKKTGRAAAKSKSKAKAKVHPKKFVEKKLKTEKLDKRDDWVFKKMHSAPS